VTPRRFLRLANPDKTATGPNDKRQKLVYTIEQPPACSKHPAGPPAN
jgi:hypothetical protein